MSNALADIFAAVHLDLETGKFVADAAKVADTAGASMSSRLSASIKKNFSGDNLGKGVVEGLGLAGGLGIASVVGKMVDIAGEAVTAFRDDEVSIQKLGTALKDNVPNWDGNTAAIERVLKARMKLGFSDDDQRASLATLVTSTHDVTKSLDLEAGAMDIARARHVDLATASDAVAKAYAGNTKGLKNLIPGLNLGKNSTEALANAFKAVGGAAADFATTDLGKAEVSSVKFNEAMERLGSVLSGPVADGTAAVADGLTQVIDALDATGDAARDNSDPLDNIGNLLHDLFKKPEEDPRTTLGALGTGLDQINNNVGDAAAAINDFWTIWDDHSNLAERRMKRLPVVAAAAVDETASAVEAGRGRVEAGFHDMSIASDSTAADMESNRGRMADALNAVSKSLTKTADMADTAGARMRNSWKKTVDYIVGKANELISDAWDPIIAKDDLATDNIEVNAARKTLAIKATTAEQKTAAREAKASLDSLMQDTATKLVVLASAGDTNSKEFKAGLANLKTYAAGLKGTTKTSVNAAIAEIERLEHIHITTPPVIVPIKFYAPQSLSSAIRAAGYTGNTDLYKKNPFRAAGGPVSGGTPYIVGERGPEMFVPKTSGTIVPNNAIGGHTFNITVNGVGSDVSAAAARGFTQRIADGMAETLREQTARRGAA